LLGGLDSGQRFPLRSTDERLDATGSALFQLTISRLLKWRRTHTVEDQVRTSGVGNTLRYAWRDEHNIAWADVLRREVADFNPPCAFGQDVALLGAFHAMQLGPDSGLHPRPRDRQPIVCGIAALDNVATFRRGELSGTVLLQNGGFHVSSNAGTLTRVPVQPLGISYHFSQNALGRRGTCVRHLSVSHEVSGPECIVSATARYSSQIGTRTAGQVPSVLALRSPWAEQWLTMAGDMARERFPLPKKHSPRNRFAKRLRGCCSRIGTLAISGLLIAAVACGGGTSTGAPPPQPPPATPSITSFQPTSGMVGAAVSISGSNLTGATALSFNGTAATFTVNSATQISTTVPGGATTGKISVTTPNGSASSAADFTVTATPPAPTITSFAPTTGPVGTSVVITGTDFTGATAVTLNGMATGFLVNSNTQITSTVPIGATTGRFSVTTPGGTATSTSDFTVTIPAPTISSFNPTTGPAGTPVIIAGTNLTGATAVSLNGTTASFTVNSATQIAATVPTGATTGKFSVTTPGGTAISANNFTVTTGSTTLDLTIDGFYITQATQEYPNPTVPLVQDRSAWVRVFVKANQSNTVMPQVQVQFINGSTTNTLTINAPSSAVPTDVDPNTNASWNAAVPSSWIQPGVQVVATVDPSNTIPEADETNNQTSTTTLDVRTLKTWKITLIPVHTKDGLTGSVTTGGRTAADMVEFAKRLHPVPDAVDVAVGGTLNSSVTTLVNDGTGWSTVLNEVSAKRTSDGATDRYYYGLVKVNYSSGVAGLGFIGFPAAMGWDYSSAPAVLAHEVGHNFGRQHSPCGGASSPDPNYPYPGGLIGVPGWDAFATSGNLKNSATYTDIMGYCSPQWVSDYVYKSVLDFRANSTLGLVLPDVVSGTSGQEGLLVWGRITNGQTILEPAFRVPFTGVTPESGPYTWEARDALGSVLASVPFDAPEVADLPNATLRVFSFVVPMTPDIMNNIYSLHVAKDGRELAGALPTMPTTRPLTVGSPVVVQRLPQGRAQLSWNARQYSMLMLRDAQTGEVRGFLRGGSASIEDVPDDLEVQFSDGVHAGAVHDRRQAQ